VASASLAGTRPGCDGGAAVKVQYPEIATLVHADLGSLRLVLGALARVERDFEWEPLLDELTTALPRELDFEPEGRASERMARNLAARRDVRIPAGHWEGTRAACW
jgi:predicted unusual protein kinase regulating ubiquinone biosynthesis (AarF/ABC1/UbiB family)